MSEHTPGRIRYTPLDRERYPLDDECSGEVADERGRLLFTVWERSIVPDGYEPVAGEEVADSTVRVPEHAANGRRLAACWNACLGVPTDELESFVRGVQRADEREPPYQRQLALVTNRENKELFDDFQRAEKRGECLDDVESYVVVLEEAIDSALDHLTSRCRYAHETWRDETFALDMVQDYGEARGRLILGLMKALDREHHDRREEPNK